MQYNLQCIVKSTKEGLEQGLVFKNKDKDKDLTFKDKDFIHKDQHSAQGLASARI